MLQSGRKLLGTSYRPLPPLRNPDMTLLLLLLAACPTESKTTRVADLPALPPKLSESVKPASEARPFREAVIAFTAEVQGEVEPCGCPTTPYGGFARRERMLEKARTMGPPVFVLDAGEMLLKGTTALDAADRKARADAVLDLALGTGLDAWAASPLDLVPGGIALLERSNALSASWFGPDGANALPPAMILDRGGVKLGVIGLSAPVEGLTARDPEESVIAAMQGEVDAWIVLSNESQAVNRKVAAIPGVGMIMATAGEVVEDPDGSFGAPILESAPRGRFVTLVHLSMGTRTGAFEVTNKSPFREHAAARERGAPAEAEAKAKWEASQKAVHQTLVEATAGHNFAVVSSVPLASDWDEGAAAGSALSRIEAFRAATLARAEATVQTTTETGYAGVGSCGSCHADRLVQWVYDPHANALDALITRKESKNPECIACHTTGFGRPGGFSGVEPRETEPFKGVQCEACHGPQRGHSRKSDITPVVVTERTCRTCHDKANSPQFDYSSYLARISCSRIGAGTEADPATVTPVPTRKPVR